MTERWHPGRPGPYSQKLDMETLCEGNSITATEPRPKKIDVVLRVVAFVGFLGVVFLFAAVGKIGN